MYIYSEKEAQLLSDELSAGLFTAQITDVQQMQMYMLEKDVLVPTWLVYLCTQPVSVSVSKAKDESSK